MSDRRRVRLLTFVVVLLAAGVYLAGNGRAALFDRDEPRYAQTSRQMLAGGDWVVPRLLDKVRTAKPPLIYWCQAAAMRVFGDAPMPAPAPAPAPAPTPAPAPAPAPAPMPAPAPAPALVPPPPIPTGGGGATGYSPGVFAARFPSAAGVTLTLALLAVALGRFVGPRRALWTVFVLATSAIVVGWSAKVCLTDGVLLLFATAAQLCLYALWRGRGGWPATVVLAVALALALLTKGPVVLGFLGTTLLALYALTLIDRRIASRAARRARPPGPVPHDPARPVRTTATAATATAAASSAVSAAASSAAHSGGAVGEASPDVDADPRVVLAYRARRAAPATGESGRRLEGFVARGITKVAVAVVVIAVIGGPWLFLVERRSPGFIYTTVSHDVLRRTFEPLEQHFGPPGYYLLTIWGTYFPWSLLLPATIALAWRHRRLPPVRFALAAVVGPWVMMECVRTKLPHYLLPCFPPLAFLTADALVRCARGRHHDLRQKPFLVAAGLWAVIVIALGFAPWLAPRQTAGAPAGPPLAPDVANVPVAPTIAPDVAGAHVAPDVANVPVAPTIALDVANVLVAPTIALDVAGVLLGVIPFAFFLRRRPLHAAAAMGLGTMLVITIAWGWYLPNAAFLRLPPRVAALLARAGADGPRTRPNDVQMTAYKEPSLAYYQGGTIREQPENAYLATHPPAQWPTWTVLPRDVYERLPPPTRDRLTIVGSETGLNYAGKGRTVDVMVVRKRD